MIKSSKLFAGLYRSLLTFVSSVLLCTGPSSLAADWSTPPYDFPSSAGRTSGGLAADANGHAFAVYDDTIPNQVFASYYTGTTWAAPQLIINSAVNTLDIAMDDTGTALVVAYVQNTGQILSAHFDGTSWSVPLPNPVTTISSSLSENKPQVAMNGPNSGVAIWGDATTGILASSFFLGTTWSAPVNIATGQTAFVDYNVSYTANGTAVALWSTGTAVMASNYIGGIWQAPVTLDNTVGNTGVSVGIDDNGIAHGVWINSNGDVVTATFDGIWEPNEIISTDTPNISAVIAVAHGGTAVATWVDSSQEGFSSAYNGTTWSLPKHFADGPIASNFGSVFNSLSVSVDINGNALAIWGTDSYEIKSARLAVGAAAWCPEELVGISGEQDIFRLVQGALSANGRGFAFWSNGLEAVRFEASVSLPLAPVTNVQVRKCVNKFATQKDYVDIITWTPSVDPGIFYYEIRRNGELVAVIPPNGPFVYVIHNFRRAPITDVYTITAFGCGGGASEPVIVVFQ